MGLFSFLKGKDSEGEEPQGSQESAFEPLSPGLDEEVAPSLASSPVPLVGAPVELSANQRLAGSVQPLDIKRIGSIFDQKGWRYDYDDDGDIQTGFNGNVFNIMTTGNDKEILHVLGGLTVEIPEEVKENVRQFIDDWHRDTMWPKLYYMYDNQGILRLRSEFAIDCEEGVSDSQLEQHLQCVISTSCQAFDKAREVLGFPAVED